MVQGMSFAFVFFFRGSDHNNAACVARRRVNFTPEDDERLAYYMATIFPDAESGGRMGNKYYQELERLVCPSPLSFPCSVLTSHLASPPDLIFIYCRCMHTRTGRGP